MKIGNIDIIEFSYFGNMIEETEFAYILLSKYEEFNEEKFVECVNNYTDDLHSEGYFVPNYYHGEEIIEDYLSYYVKYPPQTVQHILHKWTDFDGSDTREWFMKYCERWDLDYDKLREELAL